MSPSVELFALKTMSADRVGLRSCSGLNMNTNEENEAKNDFNQSSAHLPWNAILKIECLPLGVEQG